MKEIDVLRSLYEDVRAYFKFEHVPEVVKIKEMVLKNTMHRYRVMRDSGEFDEEDEV